MILDEEGVLTFVHVPLIETCRLIRQNHRLQDLQEPNLVIEQA
jgi:hypothetical protein